MQDTKTGYRNLVIWQKADKLAYEDYLATKDFPKEEIYGLTSQIRRAALSVALNIVEGYARQSKNEMRRFVSISLGSLSETEYLLDFARRLTYLTDAKFSKLNSIRQEVGAVLWSYRKGI